MSDLDTLRWGDTQTLAFDPGVADPKGMATRQMVSAKWRRPLGWVCNVVIAPQFNAETGTFVFQARITQGIGGGLVTSVKTYTLAPVGGVYDPIFDSFELAAQDIQIDVALVRTAAAVGGPESVQIGVFVAPITEPHAMTAILDQTDGGLPPPHRRWMHDSPSPGFEPAPLGYQPYR